MVSINYAAREVTCKIVYYGPGLSGKTTNLLYVHKKVPPTTRGKMISLATEADRTLYFDFLPINIGAINGFAAKFQLYTVPGQVYYNATRKLVLRGVDGLVFVADSQAEKMDENIESLTNLKDNLAEYGYNIDEMPIVIQYNKRDLTGVLSVAELEAKLNAHGWKCFEAEAVTGKGVFDTLKMIIKLVLEKAKNSHNASQVTKEPKGVGGKVAAEMTSQPEPATQQPVHAYPPASESPIPDRQSVYEAGSKPTHEYGEPESAPEKEVEYGTLKESRAIDEPMGTPVPVDSRVEETSVAGAEIGVQRPFPGSTTSRILRRERRITVSDFQPASKEEETPALRGHFAGEAIRQESSSGLNLPAPTMAPAQRIVRKKQGFFKRLFGIK